MASHCPLGERSMLAITITLLAVTTVLATMRLAGPVLRGNRIETNDVWLMVAFLFHVALSVLFLSTASIFLRVWSVAEGRMPPYPALITDGVTLRKTIFSATVLHWCILWSVKCSLLAFYKKIIRHDKRHLRFWWLLVVASFLAYIGPVFSLTFACGPHPGDTFVANRCTSAANTRGTVASLWVGYVCDVVTDGLIMFIPFGVICRRTRMAMKRKFSIGSIFTLAFLCIATATVRVYQVNKTLGKRSASSVIWLILWSIIETSIAVIIGCSLGIYSCLRQQRKIRKQKKKGSRTAGNRKGKSSLTQSNSNTQPTIIHHDNSVYDSMNWPRHPPNVYNTHSTYGDVHARTIPLMVSPPDLTRNTISLTRCNTIASADAGCRPGYQQGLLMGIWFCLRSRWKRRHPS